MILIIGSSNDKVYPRLLQELENSGQQFVIIDEDNNTNQYAVNSDTSNGKRIFRILGGDCKGDTPVGSIFVRHAVARTMNSHYLNNLGILQKKLNAMLVYASCPVVNLPFNAYSNYSKPHQLDLLAQAGFDVPDTLLTNIPEEVVSFHKEHNNQTIFKGASNVMSLAQLLKSQSMERLRHLRNSPTQFQEYIHGPDYRVHIIDNAAFVTKLKTSDVDYRRSSLSQNEDIIAKDCQLPSEIVDKCVKLTKTLGLVLSGIDFKEDASGRLVALELNPFPQFTFYEGRSGQNITKAVVQYLVHHSVYDSNIFA
jgi:glutathione synthase/RimK-type ligase-like ATP-grasp enzyme